VISGRAGGSARGSVVAAGGSGRSAGSTEAIPVRSELGGVCLLFDVDERCRSVVNETAFGIGVVHFHEVGEGEESRSNKEWIGRHFLI